MYYEAPTLKAALSKAIYGHKKKPQSKPSNTKPSTANPAHGSKPARFGKRQMGNEGAIGQSPAQQRLGAGQDFARNYNNMRQANTIGADKYFHCVANC